MTKAFEQNVILDVEQFGAGFFGLGGNDQKLPKTKIGVRAPDCAKLTKYRVNSRWISHMAPNAA
ncbi:hypothetical protein [Aquimonas voraii]|uniref:hypothetical protein n=1 Tax=Aquimonas voraii TaxID=265719 RepID=UPI0015A0A502|nr:hypothetical protein [Aquimonas voraii]